MPLLPSNYSPLVSPIFSLVCPSCLPPIFFVIFILFPSLFPSISLKVTDFHHPSIRLLFIFFPSISSSVIRVFLPVSFLFSISSCSVPYSRNPCSLFLLPCFLLSFLLPPPVCPTLLTNEHLVVLTKPLLHESQQIILRYIRKIHVMFTFSLTHHELLFVPYHYCLPLFCSDSLQHYFDILF